MSSRIFQSVLLEMREATSRVIGVIDDKGDVISCNALSSIGEKREDAAAGLNVQNDSVTRFDGFTYKAIASWSSSFEYAVFVEGEDELAKSVCILSAIALTEAKSAYDEKHDKSTFIKNIILDNILPGDIFVRSKELHFDNETQRVALLIRQTGEINTGVFDILQRLFPDSQRDFVVNINDTDAVLVKEVKAGISAKDLHKLARAIEETLSSEIPVKTVIGIGGIASGLKEIAGSYKEAQVAIDVGKVFEVEKTIVNYESLGIGRLIYQLPTTLCEMFLSEVFKKNSIEALDAETLFTIQKFFENNLNVSETSRKLFVHRNTLVYRLEKIKKLTGLDLREFDHAIVFKVALMVKKYLTSRNIDY